MLGLGFLGFLMRRIGIPEAPLVITFLIAPLLEDNLRRALLINRGDWWPALFGSSLGIGLAGFALFMLLLTFKMNVGRRLSAVGRQEETDAR
jgi:putative tricarboxylic transport membrane protein